MQLVSLADVAELAQVSRPAVSNWRRRHADFPKPVSETGTTSLFALSDVQEWLARHRKQASKPSLRQILWSVLNQVRGVATVNEALSASRQLVALHVLARELGIPSPAKVKADALVDHLHNINEAARHEGLASTRYFDIDEIVIYRSAPMLSEVARLLDSHSPTEIFEALVDANLDRQGRAGDAFTTPPSIAKLMVSLAAPIRGRVVDPCSGLATTLLTAYQHRDPESPLRLVGYELDEDAWRASRQRLIVHGLTNASIRIRDSLDPPLEPGCANILFADPPLAIHNKQGQRSDTLWLHQSVRCLAPAGRAFHLSGLGLLFGSGGPERARRELLEQGCVEAIVALPAGLLLPRTGIRLALWILRPAGSDPQPVLLVDADNLGSQKELTDSDVDTVLTCYRRWRDHRELTDRDLRCTTVSVEKLLAAGADLQPAKWLAPSPNDRIEIVRQAEDNTRAAMAAAEEATALVVLPGLEAGECQRLTLEELSDGHRVRIIGGTRIPVTVQEGRTRLIRGSDIQDDWTISYTHTIDTTAGDDVTISQPDDVIVTCGAPYGVRAAVDQLGGSVVASPASILRVTDPTWLHPSALAALLTGDWNKRGTTSSVRALEVPELDPGQTDWLVGWLEQLVTRHRVLADAADACLKLATTAVAAIGSGARASINLKPRKETAG